MSELFEEQLQALRARALHRKLREIGTPQGAEVRIVGRQLVNFSSNDYLGLAADPLPAAGGDRGDRRVWRRCGRLAPDQWDTQSPHVVLETTLAKWRADARGDLLQQRLRGRGRNAAGPRLETGCRDSR